MPISIQELKKLKPVTKEDDERLKKEAKKEYMQEYNVKHKEQIKQYHGINKEVIKANVAKYYEENKEEKKEYNGQYYIDNKEKLVEQHKQYLKDNPDKISEMDKRKNARRRKLGFNPINEHFEGGEWHHINKNDVVCIPVELHRSVPHNLKTGKNMEEINDLVMEFMLAELGEC